MTHWEERICLGKRRFPSPLVAYRVARKIEGRRWRGKIAIYACTVGGVRHWHHAQAADHKLRRVA